MINTYLCMYVCTYDMIVHSNVNSKHKSQNCNRLQKYKRPFEKQKKKRTKTKPQNLISFIIQKYYHDYYYYYYYIDF